jgi:hypothetical protein
MRGDTYPPPALVSSSPLPSHPSPQARELKSVYIKARGNFVKLLLHKCYINPLNLFSQVGLIAVNVLGIPLPQQPAALMGKGGGGGGGGR